tara:strand:+ start:1283 stop:1441 length:159 start_codon:yes stop_codon:yes gene_type:complete
MNFFINFLFNALLIALLFALIIAYIVSLVYYPFVALVILVIAFAFLKTWIEA